MIPYVKELLLHSQDLTTTVPPLGGALDNWLWNLGDGNTSTNQNPTHQYANAGIYIVNLTVTDINGCQGYYSDTIVVILYQLPTSMQRKYVTPSLQYLLTNLQIHQEQ